MSETYKRLFAKLQPVEQQQLLAFWDGLDEAGQSRLAEQIDAIDFEQLAELFTHRDDVADLAAILAQAKSPPGLKMGDAAGEISPEAAWAAGAEAIATGEVGVVIVAGGQGTRLGFDAPKGTFPIGPVTDRTLFQIHVEKVLARSRRHGARIPLYIMTSPATHEATVAFFDENHRFGLPADDLIIFCQGTMPAVDMRTGEVLLSGKDQIALSPDGHGGMVAALQRSGALADMDRRGIKYLYYLQVDNPLIDVAGEEYLGYHVLTDSELSSQVVRKQDPMERVGNVVQVGESLQIVEYSDLPDDVANRREPDGELSIWAGSIAVHVFSVELLRRMLSQAGAMPFHIAKKKVAHLTADGTRVEPTEPNAIKFERFIFDVLPHAKRPLVVEIDPAEGFAPLKNAPGAATDTPEYVREMLSAWYVDRLRRLGREVADGTILEVSPLLALDETELADRVPADGKLEGEVCLGP